MPEATTSTNWRQGAPAPGCRAAWLRTIRVDEGAPGSPAVVLAVAVDGCWFEADDWRASSPGRPVVGEITHHTPFEPPGADVSAAPARGPYEVYGDSYVGDRHGHVATAETALFAGLIRDALNAHAGAVDEDEPYYLVSFAHPSKGFVSFWRPDNAGYTPYLEQAGIYRRSGIKPGYHDSEDTVPVPVRAIQALSVRCIDRCLGTSAIFRSPAVLREALADGF